MSIKKKALVVAMAGMFSAAAYATSDFDAPAARACYNNPDNPQLNNLTDCSAADIERISQSESVGEAVGATLDFIHSLNYATIGDRYMDTPGAGGVPAATAPVEDGLVAALSAIPLDPSQTPDPAEFAEMLDTNGDGEITPEDFGAGELPGQDELVAAFDTNGDGEITPEDFEGTELPGQAELVGIFDSNGDGEITPEDFEGTEIPGQAELVEAFDTNGDGEITPEDFEGAELPGQAELVEAFDTNGDGEITPEDFEGGLPGQDEIVAIFDTNGDGELTPEDFEGGELPGQAELVEAFDTNGDGEITPEDFEGGELPGQEDIVAIFDSNGDGELTPEDFEAPTSLENQLITAVNTVTTPLGVSVKDQDGSGDYGLQDVLYTTMNAEPEAAVPALVQDVGTLLDNESLASVVDLVRATTTGDPDEIQTAIENLAPTQPGGGGDDYTHRLPLRVTGNIAGANDTCSVNVSGGNLNFDFVALSFAAFDGRSRSVTFSVQCGADRAEPAGLYMSTTETDPETGGGSSEMAATVTPTNGGDPIESTVRLFYDPERDGNGVEIGQSESVESIGSTSKSISLFAEVDDRDLFAEGASIAAADDTQQLYVWLK